ncbi:MAG: MFS transporter [Planctomycetota bacterium]
MTQGHEEAQAQDGNHVTEPRRTKQQTLNSQCLEFEGTKRGMIPIERQISHVAMPGSVAWRASTLATIRGVHELAPGSDITFPSGISTIHNSVPVSPSTPRKPRTDARILPPSCVEIAPAAELNSSCRTNHQDCQNGRESDATLNLVPVILLAIAHCLIDSFALFIQPLWPDLELKVGSTQWLYVLWSMTSSATQLFFGYFGDRYRGRWMVWAAPIVSVVCLSALGIANSFWSVCAILIIGGLGVGAFHPEAAAMVGACAPKLRSRAMSIFVLGGSIGQAIGPAYSGFVTTHFGLPALAWSATWGITLVLLIAWYLRRIPDDTPQHAQTRRPSAKIDREKRGTLFLVLVIGILRVIPPVGVLLGLAFMLKSRGMANEDIGWAQSVFQFASGAGVFGCAVLVRHSRERLILWLLPLFAIPTLYLSATASYGWLLVCLTWTGLAFGGATPVLISYAQQLLPNGQRLASSITMGVSWGLGGAIVAGMMSLFEGMGAPHYMFYVAVPAAFLSSLLCAWLPVHEHETTFVEATPPKGKAVPST